MLNTYAIVYVVKVPCHQWRHLWTCNLRDLCF